MWTMRAFAYGAIMASAVLVAGPVVAQNFWERLILGTPGSEAPQEWQMCQGRGGATIEQRINGCTTAIATEGDKHNLAGAYTNRGRAYEDRGDMDHAIQDFSEAIRNDPKLAGAYFGRGTAYTGKGAYDLAIQDYNQAIRFEPSNSEALFNRGTNYSMQGQYDRAIADFDQAIRLKPIFPAAFNNRCSAHAKAGQLQQALADCEEAWRQRPN